MVLNVRSERMHKLCKPLLVSFDFYSDLCSLKIQVKCSHFLALRILALKHFSRSRSHATFPPRRSQSPINQPKKWKMRRKPYIRRSIPHPLHTRKKNPISRPLLFTARCIIIENATASCFPISRSNFPPSHSAKKAIKGHMYSETQGDII